MRHARDDWNGKDMEQLIPGDEPVFLIRGKDKGAAVAVRAYAEIASEHGADPEMVRMCEDWAGHIEAWQEAHRTQIPDVPEDCRAAEIRG